MIGKEQLDKLLPTACKWAEQQEKIILEKGIPLDDDLQIDAYLVGVKEILKVRLLKVEHIPIPPDPELKSAVQATGLLTQNTIGVTFRYGIYIRSDFWKQRRLIVHELAHTMQYERMGGFDPFLKHYLDECITLGYPNGELEQEAKRIESRICS